MGFRKPELERIQLLRKGVHLMFFPKVVLLRDFVL